MLNHTTSNTECFNTNNEITLMTVPEVAEYLGIGKNRAYELLQNGTIKAFRIGATWKVTKLAIDQYILSQSGIQP